MITFFVSLALLIAGYIVYGAFVEKIFGIDPKAETPAIRLRDNVDFVPMSTWKIFLIQFLNIAGLGPIFGAIAGAMWGPVAFLWIVFGCILGGGVHDYLSGMLSLRHDGKSIPEIVGKYLGVSFKQFMRGFTVILMIIVGAVFIKGPASILNDLTNSVLSINFWVALVLVYYILATLLPIDKLIGRIYPVFGFALLFMALGIIIGLFSEGYHVPELTFSNLINMHSNPGKFSVFPMLFVTVACGAISGFHSTQSPLMARCLKSEKLGRRVFYGAMVAEGIVALIWAAAAMAFFGSVDELNTAMNEHKGNAAWAVNIISNTLLGKVGAILAILGVVAAPITSGDTAFRSARLIVADFLNLNQKPFKNRLYISIPLFAIGFALVQADFAVIWRYMAWSNQTLAMIVLWAISVYLAINKKFYLITLFPAMFMTMICVSYIIVAPEGFHLPLYIGNYTGIGVSILITILFFFKITQKNQVLPE